MKFGDKLFVATTAVLTIIFTVFGIWMLSSYFQRLLNREIEQSNMESQMYQYLFEMAYQTMEEYGHDYALPRAIDSAVENVEKDGISCFILDEEKNVLYGTLMNNAEYETAILELLEELEPGNSYVYGVRKIQEEYCLLHICVSTTEGGSQYLGLCKDLTEIYEDRDNLMNQYRMALVALLVIGGSCIYALSRWITRPIRDLERVAGRIAAGNYEMRSKYQEKDEIGELAISFNHMADKLVEQMQEKELEAKQKEDFTAAFAHELKTPLTSIIGYADMLNTIELSAEEKQEAYYYIFQQGKRLESLSHKLLELVSLNRQTFQGKAVPTKMIEENIRTTMRPIFQKRGIKGRITMEKAYLYGDYELLLSLFYNLLDNAVKAVEEEGFILFKGVRLEGGYEVKIVDNGRGIPQEEIARITEAFYMVDKSRSRKEGGAGIGMALCKQIVELHQGSMHIESKPGEGTVIRLHFPNVQVGAEDYKEKEEKHEKS